MTDVWDTLRADLYRYRADIGRRALRSAFREEPGFRFTYYLRKVHFYSSRKRSWGVFGVPLAEI